MAGQVADEAVVDAVLTASRTLVAVATRSLGAAAEDTTIAQYRALVVLASQGPQRMVDLAAALDVTPPTAGRMCDRLLRRGTDIDRPPAADPFEDLSAADAMRPFAAPLTLAAQPPGRPGGPGPDRAPLPGPVTHQHHPQVLFAGESLAQALRQLELYSRDGLPVISADGRHLQGWITSQNVLQAVARHMHATPGATAQAQPAAEPVLPGRPAAPREPPAPLHGYQILEITIPAGSPAAGQTLGDTSWPPGWVPVSVLDNHALRDPDPGITLAPGDRISLLVPEPRSPGPARSPGEPADQPDAQPPDAPPAAQAPAPASGEQPRRPGPGGASDRLCK